MVPNTNRGMGKKPVPLIASGAKSTTDVMWATIRKLKTFSSKALLSEINRTLPVKDRTVKLYVDRLLKGHYLTVKAVANVSGCRREHVYELINDVGIDTPQLTMDGTPSPQGMAREQLWRAMRIMGDFDAWDLMLAASTERKAIRISVAVEYIKHLYDAGYLAKTTECSRGLSPRRARYHFLPSMFSGPKPPQVQQVKQVFDPNLGKVMPKVNREESS